jgi:hypothetical protein
MPEAQMTTVGEVVNLVDATTGFAATLTPDGENWQVREGRPAGAGEPPAARLRRGQHLRHP